MAVHTKEMKKLLQIDGLEALKPSFLVYSAYFALCVLAINTTFLVFENTWLKYIFVPSLLAGYLFSYYVPRKWYILINQGLDISGIAVTVLYILQIAKASSSWGTMLAELLCLLLIMKSFKLFTVGDFFMPLMMSATLMVFSSLPSYSASYVISLFIYMVLLGFALFSSQLRESTRLERRPREALFRFSYRPSDYTGDPPLSRKTWRELWPYLSSGLKASLVLAIITFVVCSLFFFQAERHIDDAKKSTLSRAFAGTAFAESGSPRLRDDELVQGREVAQAGGSGTLYPGFDEEFDISRGRFSRLNNPTPVMKVKSNVETYYRGKSFDTYIGQGWIQSEKSEDYETVHLMKNKQTNLFSIDLSAKSRGFDIDPLTADKTAIRQKYTIAEGMPRTDLLFTSYQANKLLLRFETVAINNEFNIRHPSRTDILRPGHTYEVESYKLLNPQRILKGQTYRPENFPGQDFIDRYTQLPWDEYHEQYAVLQSIAGRETRGVPSQYDQVIKLIEFLRDNYHYSLEPPSVVPEGKDAVYFFLVEWEKKQGHCEYFASSLAVLARSIEIPCRVVTGYSSGDYSLGGFVVRQRHAHAWVEVYFPYIGWVEFDPTPATPWYERGLAGIGGAMLSANNAIEELYVFNPGGYFRKHIRPRIFLALRFLFRSGASVYSIFATIEGRTLLWDKMLGSPRWWGLTCGLIALALLLFELGYFIVLGPTGYCRRLITRRGRGWLNKLELSLMKNGYLDDGYHTPSQITNAAIEAGSNIAAEPLEIYLRARYHWFPPAYAEYWKMRRGFIKLIRTAKSRR